MSLGNILSPNKFAFHTHKHRTIIFAVISIPVCVSIAHLARLASDYDNLYGDSRACSLAYSPARRPCQVVMRAASKYGARLGELAS